jgi:photosystem II stability/assembly factor-like uncharacterized protein
MSASSTRTLLTRVAATVGTAVLLFGATGCLNSTPKQSGVFVTHDNGSSWTSTPDLQSPKAKTPKTYPPLSVGAVGVSPKNAKYVVAGTDDDLFQSTDGGASWERLTQKLPTSTKAIVVHQVVFSPSQENAYYAVGVSGGYGKVIKTTDGGKTLQDVFTNSQPGQAVTSLVIQPETGAIFVADQLGSIYRSADGGASWQRIFSVGNYPVSSLALAGNTLFAGTVGAGVWRSTDGGGSFVPVGGNLPNKAQTVWAMTSGFGGVYAGTDKGLFLTKNSGASWQSVGNPLPAGGERVQALAISGSNLYFASNAVVFRTNPEGTNFVPSQLKLVKNVFSLAATPAAVGTLYAGGSAGSADFINKYSAGISNKNLIPGN